MRDNVGASGSRDRGPSSQRQTGMPVTDAVLAGLIEAVAAGNRDALCTIFALETSKLHKTARRVTGQSSRAEDAVQTAMMNVLRHAARFDRARGSARGWLHAIVRNAAREAVRYDHRHLPVDAEALCILIDARDMAADGVGNGADLARAFARLSLRKRRAVLLVHGLGYTQEEAATIMGVPLGTCKAWIRRGLRELRATLEGAAP